MHHFKAKIPKKKFPIPVPKENPSYGPAEVTAKNTLHKIK